MDWWRMLRNLGIPKSNRCRSSLNFRHSRKALDYPVQTNKRINLVHDLSLTIFWTRGATPRRLHHLFMKIEDRAYLAGLIDGEGTVSLIHERPGAKYRHPCVSIASTSIELLDWLGGNVRTKKTYQAHHKTSYHWDITGQKAIKLLDLILPFMKEKKKIARANMLLNEYPKLTKRKGKYNEQEISEKLAFEKMFFEL